MASALVHVNTLGYIKSHASENRQVVMSLERCCRRIDLLLDALLCEGCKEDKADLFATFSRKQTNSMSHSDTKTIGVQTDSTTLTLLKRLDALLDRYLCKGCRYDKNQLSLSDLSTWAPDRNCRECRYVFDAADDPDPDVCDFYSERGMPEQYYFPPEDYPPSR